MSKVIPYTPTERQFSRERLEAEERLANLIAELREYTRTATAYPGHYGDGLRVAKEDVAAILDAAEKDMP